MLQYKRVQARDRDSILEFTRHYLTMHGFFPEMPALHASFPTEAINALADRFHKRLNETLPQRHSAWSAPIVSKESLIRLERRVPNGLLTDPGRVMLRSAQPIERNYEFAVWIRENLQSDVSYRYYFSKSLDLGPVALMVQAFAVAGIEALKEVERRRDKMSEHGDAIQENLELMRQHVEIMFLIDPSPQEFVAYNYTDVNSARYYIRYQDSTQDGMILLYCGHGACNAVKHLDEITSNGNVQLDQSHLFRGTSEVPLYTDSEVRFRERLQRAILTQFPPSLSQAVKNRCFRPTECEAEQA